MEELRLVISSGSLVWAVPVALLGGFLSFFSPCIIPLLPAYLSYMSGVSVETIVGQDATRSGGGASGGTSGATAVAVETAPRSRMALAAVLFVAGFAATFTALGVAVGSVGRWLFSNRDTISLVAGLVLVVLGVMLVLDRRLGLLGRTLPVKVPSGGIVAAPFIGAALAVTWLPCIGPILGAIYTLGYLGSAERNLILLGAYSIGLGLPFLIAAVAFTRFSGTIAWMRRHHRAVAVTSGSLLIAVGALLALGLWLTIAQQVQVLALDWGFTGV